MARYKNGRASDSLIGRTKYDQMLAAYREHPGVYARASRAAGVTRDTAKRAWLEGWPSRKLAAIRDVLEEEQLLARSRRQSAVLLSDAPEPTDFEGAAYVDSRNRFAPTTSGPEAARMMAKDDAVASRSQEGQMVKLSRANTIALMSATSRLLSAGIGKARELETQLKTSQVPMTPREVQRFLSSLGYLTSKAAEAAKLNIEMERLLLGEPTEIIGMDVRNMSLEDAARTIEMANRALARARSRGLVPASTPDLTEADVPPSDPEALH